MAEDANGLATGHKRNRKKTKEMDEKEDRKKRWAG